MEFENLSEEGQRTVKDVSEPKAVGNLTVGCAITRLKLF